MTEVQQEARRIWVSVPRPWGPELEKLPEFKVICGVRWHYQLAVKELLMRAWRARKTNIVHPGMTAEVLYVAADLSGQGRGDGTTEI